MRTNNQHSGRCGMKKVVTENEYRELKNEVVLQREILESIRDVLDGKEVSDFMMSFGIVRRVCDLIDGPC